MNREWFASAAIFGPILVKAFKENFTSDKGVVELEAAFLPTPCKCPECKRLASFRFIRMGLIKAPEFNYYIWGCMNCGLSVIHAVDKATGEKFEKVMDFAPRLETLTTTRKKAQS